jgi:hypothetical protein
MIDASAMRISFVSLSLLSAIRRGTAYQDATQDRQEGT